MANGRHIANRKIAASQQTRSSAITERPHEAPCHLIFRCHVAF